ncbi:MAG: hypothetical protein WAN48_10770 [Actinomycetes bacterium]
MSRILACLACGIESRDVSMRLVEVPAPDRRTVQAHTPLGETNRGPAGFEYRDVPERYVNEPRCHDADACQERVWAMAPLRVPEPVVVAPEPADEPESAVPSWL